MTFDERARKKNDDTKGTMPHRVSHLVYLISIIETRRTAATTADVYLIKKFSGDYSY